MQFEAFSSETSAELVRQHIRDLCEAAGVKPSKLAELAEVAPSTVTRFLKGESNSLRTETFAALQRAAKTLIPRLDIEQTLEGLEAMSKTDILETPFIGPLTSDKSTMPVYATAVGGPTDMLLNFNDDPIQYTKTPGPLLNVKGGFGVFIVGNSMSPAYDDGDIALVHPKMEPRAGDDVLIELEAVDGWRSALVKRLVRMDDKVLELTQFSPAITFPIQRSRVHLIRVLVGRYKKPRRP